jgi:hypothetical protein
MQINSFTFTPTQQVVGLTLNTQKDKDPRSEMVYADNTLSFGGVTLNKPV